MNETLIRLNRHWNEGEYTSLRPRAVLAELLAKKTMPHIQVLTGIRRSGKSTLFELLINDLLADGTPPKSILRLNLDEPVFTPFWNKPAELYALIEKAEVLTGVKVAYLFLDEVQQVKGWELFTKGAYDTKRFRKIYITGSASDLLDNQFATLLSGRYLANVVRPFSLNELLELHGFVDALSVQTRKVDLLRLCDRYLRWGGFPEIVLNEHSDAINAELLISYYESIVLKDCVTYSKIRDTELFYRLLHYLLTTIGQSFSYMSLAKALDSNEVTVRNYLTYAARSFVLSDTTNFSFSMKAGARPVHKAYCVDNGLMNTVGFQFSTNQGTLLENAVYNGLVHHGFTDIGFIQKQKECDFIARKDGRFHAFQVCYTLTDGNKSREVGGFEVLKEQVDRSSRHIITYDQQGEVDGVEVVPFYQWVMRM